jgi:hypothetical protein
MRLHWRSYRRRHRQFNPKHFVDPDITWSAVVIETVRARQRQVTSLGSITESLIAASAAGDEEAVASQVNFLNTVAPRLDALGQPLSAENRQRIEAKIAEKVPPPTKHERKAWRRLDHLRRPDRQA